MSKSRRGRRPGGHPAKVARRRERDAARSGGRPAALDPFVRTILRQAHELTGPLDAEIWGSCLLGEFWSRRYTMPMAELDTEPEFWFGDPLLDDLRGTSRVEARVALAVIAEVDAGDLGLRARELLPELPQESGGAIPDWVAELGEAVITDAAVMYEDVFDDACTVFVEARHPSGEVHAVGILIDNNLGGMAKDILLADSIDRVEEIVREHPQPDGVVRLERIAPGRAAAKIHAALELTEMTFDPPVSDEYADLRALARMRADATPGYVMPKPAPELSRVERDRLSEEFLNAPEGEDFAPDGEEAYAVSLAIDFCVDYVDGRPLRWSPAVVELFMANWIPRKVLGDAELFARIPAALDAWVRFAGRRSNLPEWAISATCESIPVWRDAMVRLSDDPGAAGPAKQFLSAAQSAGIDLADADALNTFVAGWNARSGVE